MPHVRPYAPALILVFLLGIGAALGNRSAVALTEPLMTALFGGKSSHAVLVTDEGLAPGAPRIVAAHVGRKVAKKLGKPKEERFMPWLAELGDEFDSGREQLYHMALGTLPVSPTGEEKFSFVIRIVSVFAIMAVLSSIILYSFTRLSRWIGLKVIISLRMDIARHLIGQSARYHGSQKFGDLLSRISNDVQSTLVVVNNCLKEMIEQPLLALVSLGGAFWVAPVPTLYLALTLPLLMLPVALLTKRIRKRSKKSLTVLGASVQVLSQMFQGIRTVKAFRAEEREIERYKKVNEHYLSATMKMVHAIASTHSTTQIISHLGMGVLLLAVGWFTINGGLIEDREQLLMLLLFVAPLYTSIKKITKVWTRIQESVGASARLQELLDAPTDITEKKGALALDGLGSGVVFNNVSFTYDLEDAEAGPAISNLSMQIKPGETLALVGPSGAGKSTVMDLLARFLDPDDGSISVNGHDLRDATLDSVTELYAMVGQHPFLFHTSIEENIRYGKPNATRDEIVAAARAANIHEFIESLPEGYDTDVAESGSRLSGGQRQRITIARAILKSAPLLLLDEATSALDTESEKVVQEAIESLMEDHTVVVVAHRLSTIRNADRIAVMDKGRLEELGTHAELLKLGGLYARLHEVQFAGAGVTAD